MAPLTNVLSTSAKLALALLIISVVIGVAYPVLGGMGSASVPPIPPPVVSGEEDVNTIHTVAQPAAWNSLITKAVTNQCVTDGMSEPEVLRAVGEPSVRFDSGALSSWTWHPRQLNETTIFFTTKGRVYLWSSACKSLNGIVTP